MEEVFRSYVGLDGDGAPRPTQTLTTLHSFSFSDGALPDFTTPTQGRERQHLRDYVPRRFENRRMSLRDSLQNQPQGALTAVRSGALGGDGRMGVGLRFARKGAFQ
jgi:hypothetical protein